MWGILTMWVSQLGNMEHKAFKAKFHNFPPHVICLIEAITV